MDWSPVGKVSKCSGRNSLSETSIDVSLRNKGPFPEHNSRVGAVVVAAKLLGDKGPFPEHNSRVGAVVVATKLVEDKGGA